VNTIQIQKLVHNLNDLEREGGRVGREGGREKGREGRGREKREGGRARGRNVYRLMISLSYQSIYLLSISVSLTCCYKPHSNEQGHPPAEQHREAHHLGVDC